MSNNIIYGVNTVLLAASQKRRKILEVWCTEANLSILPLDLSKVSKVMDKKQIDTKIGKNVNHQGIIAFVEPLHSTSINNILDTASDRSVILLLDAVTDVTNIGNIVRTSAFFGVDAIVYTKRNMPDILSNDVIAKNACGGLEMINLCEVSNLNGIIELLKKNNYWIVGLDGDGTTKLNDVRKMNFNKIVLILGSEGSGMKQIVKKSCDVVCSIPVLGNMESLNVCNACAIAIYTLIS